jgi:hypothetical protein
VPGQSNGKYFVRGKNRCQHPCQYYYRQKFHGSSTFSEIFFIVYKKIKNSLMNPSRYLEFTNNNFFNILAMGICGSNDLKSKPGHSKFES